MLGEGLFGVQGTGGGVAAATRGKPHIAGYSFKINQDFVIVHF